MRIKINGRRYSFTPNKNTIYVAGALVVFILLGFLLHSCNGWSIRGAKYEDVLLEYPVKQVRPCIAPDGTPTADYFTIYPPKDGDKVIYLTFDDGPSANVTPKILDVLKKYRVKATFFVLGHLVDKNPEVIERMAKEGHAIANHTYTHDYDYIYSSPEALLEEINRTKDAITNAGGGNAYADVIRFPGGAFRDERAEYKQMLIENDIPYANWNCMTGDSETKTPIASDLISRAKRSSKNVKGTSLVMLMHDAGAKQASVDALPSIIEYFKGEGYRFDVIKRK
ncbi:MAG: polysaccharide deacetylase [Clostridia bacterium]|nr:polysaccharide deacetylase [Clostridia bacterium]